MTLYQRLMTTVSGLALVIGGPAVAAAPASATAAPRSALTAALPVAGSGLATARSVTIADAAKVQIPTPAPSVAPAPLGRDGRPAGASLPVSPATGSRPAPTSTTTPADGLNKLPSGAPESSDSTLTHTVTASTTAVAGSATPAALVQGPTQGGSGCSNCATPDVTAAASATELAETVNLQLSVFANSGSAGSLCTVSLSSLLGAVTGLSGPRIQYDNAAKRFSLVIDSVPASSGDVAVQYLATSQTSDACGAWWVYSIIFSISASYPLGALLDFPYLGQDSTSILTSTNNYSFGGGYLGSAAYAMPKSVAYTGAPFNITSYSVAFSTAPVTVGGIPIAATADTYWIAAVPGTGYDLYAMPTNPAGAISLLATVRDPFTAPTRKVAQPGTSQLLDPGDGRIGSTAFQDGTVVWFAHEVDDGGLPTVRYGAIDAATVEVDTALAYHGGDSDDFNPSIAVYPAGDETDYVWVNWAYTRPSAGVAVSDTVAGVAPGQGVPELVGADLTLVSGHSTTSNGSFGRYSSAAIDPAASPSCPAGLTALTAQEYFTASGLWTTGLEQTTFC
jgi:hypothetical protein